MSYISLLEGRKIIERKKTENGKSKTETENNPHKQGAQTFLHQSKSCLCTALFNHINHPAWFGDDNPKHLEQYSNYHGKLHEGLNGFLWENP